MVQVLPEKEARVIAAQVLRGLAHLNHPEHKVIHYDLKPANCLFDAFGQVKITVRASPALADSPFKHLPSWVPNPGSLLPLCLEHCLLWNSLSCLFVRFSRGHIRPS